MSLEVWGDEGMENDGYIHEDRVQEIFIAGLQAMRETQARFVEQGGETALAQSIRANWNPEWGEDPGPVSEIITSWEYA